MSGALEGLRFALAGPGKVGRSLASWLTAAGAKLEVVVGRDDATRLPSLSHLDLLLVAVPDPALAAVATQLAATGTAPTVALHTSGSRDAAVLAPLRQQGAAVGSFHPLKAFPRPLLEPLSARGVVFGIDGDDAALALARRLAQALEAETVAVPAEARRLYHFAATFAAGGVVTLVAAAFSLATRAGVSGGVLAGYTELARGALEEVGRAGEPIAALTGPVARGDVATVEAALAALAAHDPEALPFARALVQESIRQLRRRGTLSIGQEAVARLVTP
ncbi:MAG TPA: Rossmann-like and DUF2520 domain-containing protein [Thermoanaerobaculia bacterium]|nr:Rossmann-like and DUF2520 domain-containing protein [Thermoanaerobaculia bacterium]